MRRLVTELLQDDVVVRQAMAVRIPGDVVDDAVAAGILAGQDRRAVGRAERRGVKCPGEHRAFVADAVDMRRLQEGMAADAQLVEPQIVDQYDQEIRFAAWRHVPSRCRALVSAKKGTLACRNL